jgi:hypothetical protein
MCTIVLILSRLVPFTDTSHPSTLPLCMPNTHFSRLSFNWALCMFTTARSSICVVFFFTCYHDVIDISEDISVHLIFEDGLHHSAKRGAGIVEAFGHSEIAVGVERCNKACFFFIFLVEPNLMIVGEVV